MIQIQSNTDDRWDLYCIVYFFLSFLSFFFSFWFCWEVQGIMVLFLSPFKSRSVFYKEWKDCLHGYTSKLKLTKYSHEKTRKQFTMLKWSAFVFAAKKNLHFCLVTKVHLTFLTKYHGNIKISIPHLLPSGVWAVISCHIVHNMSVFFFKRSPNLLDQVSARPYYEKVLVLKACLEEDSWAKCATLELGSKKT